MDKEKAAFENQLKSANLSAKEKAKQLEEFNRKAKDKDAAMLKQVASLKSELEDTQAREKAQAGENKEISKKLAQAQQRADARAKLSKEIAQALKNAGVDADVNPNTGDVTISFGKDFFDNGSSKLKGSMADVLQKFVPKYSESLFKDKNIAEKITSVEIVGFSSPTFGGKYIDPLSLNPQDQKAAKYNLDLSMQRAKSIFDYMFDTKKIEYSNQKKLLSLVKVSGRSFFNEGRAPAGVVPGMDVKEFCKQVDCKKSQKVIIKFNMDDKR
jgi:outer membrane protein OmpA-like peptidoglycan-associated protein